MASRSRRSLVLAGGAAAVWARSCTPYATEDAPGLADAAAVDSAPAGSDGSGGTDAATGGDSAASGDATGCDASFCDSFDDGPLGAGWTNMATTHDASLALEEAGRSLPFALRVEMPARTGSGSRQAYLRRLFPFPSRVSCTLAAWIDDLAAGDIGLLSFQTSAADGYLVELKADPGQITFAEEYVKDGGTPFVGRTTVAVSTHGIWQSLAFEADFVAAKATVKVGSLTSTYPLQAGITAATLALALGDTQDSGTSRTVVRFDDLACTLIP